MGKFPLRVGVKMHLLFQVAIPRDRAWDSGQGFLGPVVAGPC